MVSRAADQARRRKHDQRTPFPDKAMGNPAADIIKQELAKIRERKEQQ